MADIITDLSSNIFGNENSILAGLVDVVQNIGDAIQGLFTAGADDAE